MTGTYEAPTNTDAAPTIGGGALAIIGSTGIPALTFKDMKYE